MQGNHDEYWFGVSLYSPWLSGQGQQEDDLSYECEDTDTFEDSDED
jgi:hypothetical protein